MPQHDAAVFSLMRKAPLADDARLNFGLSDAERDWSKTPYHSISSVHVSPASRGLEVLIEVAFLVFLVLVLILVFVLIEVFVVEVVEVFVVEVVEVFVLVVEV